MESSKEILWNQEVILNKELSLNGFSNKGEGSFQTRLPIDFGDSLEVKFKAFIPSGITDEAAILDLDLGHVGNSKDFVSVLIERGHISVIFQNNKVKSVYMFKAIEYKWISFDMVLEKNKVFIKVGQDQSCYFEFEDHIYVSFVSFGNNIPKDGFDPVTAVKFLIKDIDIKTSYSKYSSISEAEK
jgi:hypothetical protein